MFVKPGDDVYQGMIVAENARGDDMVVNPCKEKKLTNMRASGSDKNVLLKPPRELTLELALEYIEDDELVEVTPSKIRLRKKVLTEEGRRRSERSAKKVERVSDGLGGARPIFTSTVSQSNPRENREQLGIMPPSVAPEHAAGDAFVLVAAFLVDPLHRGVHRVARDAMEPQLTEGEPGPDSHRVGGISAPPGRALADQEAAGRPAVSPVDSVQADKADVPLGLVDDRPDEIVLALGLDLLEEELFLAASDAQV